MVNCLINIIALKKNYGLAVIKKFIVFSLLTINHPSFCAGTAGLTAPLSTQPPSKNIQADKSFVTVPIEQIKNFIDAFDTIKNNYVDELNDDELFENAKIGLASQLDAYSRYLDDEQYQKLIHFTQNDLGEPSFKLKWNDERQSWEVSQLSATDVAYRQGLRNGMVIDRVEGINIQRLEERAVTSLLTGTLGSVLSLRTKLKEHYKTFDVLRDQAVSYDVESSINADGILILRIKAFQENTVAQVEDALAAAEKKNRLNAILIDIRDNPGGVLASAVDLADVFLEQGLIVTTKSRTLPTQQFQASPSQHPIKIPIAILQNRFSASAAEVFAAAMKEQNRAIILGETSYGKGAIQKLFPLNKGALQITVAYYFTPQGNLIENQGITPTIPLDIAKISDNQLIVQSAVAAFKEGMNAPPASIAPQSSQQPPHPVKNF